MKLISTHEANGIRTAGPSCERVAVSGRNRKAGLGKEDDLESVVCCGDREFASRSLRQSVCFPREFVGWGRKGAAFATVCRWTGT